MTVLAGRMWFKKDMGYKSNFSRRRRGFPFTVDRLPLAGWSGFLGLAAVAGIGGFYNLL